MFPRSLKRQPFTLPGVGHFQLAKQGQSDVQINSAKTESIVRQLLDKYSDADVEMAES